MVHVLMDIVSTTSAGKHRVLIITLRMRARDGASKGRDASFNNSNTNKSGKTNSRAKICLERVLTWRTADCPKPRN